MKIPLDQLCVRSGVLCPRCEALVKSSAITELDLEVMKVLLKTESIPDYKFLRDSEYIRSVNLGSVLIVQLNTPSIGVDQRSLVKLSKHLESYFKTRVRVVDAKNASTKDLVRNIIQPARVLGVNTLWLPDGSMEYVVRIPRTDLKHLPASQEDIEYLLSQIVGANVRIRVMES
ncbi:MAG: transcription elongation factor NusA [Sulfolobales archaeon]|nr:transcription elongation factor NusA [Sulfolobales archaeon]MDW8083519.1 transcription elongation factor NusA [Sulfolobales archaeon]